MILASNQGWIGLNLKAETTAEPSPAERAGTKIWLYGKVPLHTVTPRAYERPSRLARGSESQAYHAVSVARPPISTSKGSETGDLQSTSLMRFPTHVTMNGSDTSHRDYDMPDSDSARLQRDSAWQRRPVQPRRPSLFHPTRSRPPLLPPVSPSGVRNPCVSPSSPTPSPRRLRRNWLRA